MTTHKLFPVEPTIEMEQAALGDAAEASLSAMKAERDALAAKLNSPELHSLETPR